MKSMKRLIPILLTLIPVLSAQAEDLMTVYQLALQNDPQLQAAKEQLSAARESKSLARSQLLPTVGLGATYDVVRRDLKTLQGASVDTESTDNERAMALNLTQPIYRRDRLLQLEQADSTIAQAEAEYAAAEIDLMVRSTTTYFNILAAEDDLRVAKAEREATGRQLEQAQQRFDVGLIAITDVHEAQAAYDAARASEIAAENSLDNAWEALFEIIGPQPESDLAKLGQELALNPPVPNVLQEWSDTAQQQNYSIIAARANLESLKQEIEVSRSGHYPTLDLVGGYTMNRSDSDTATEADTGSVGLSLEVPIYTGGAVSAQTRQAQANFRATQQGLDQTRRAVNRQVRDAYRGVLSTISQVEALKAATVSAQSALESTQAGYEVGTRTIVDVLNVQRNLFSSQRDYLNSRYSYIINGLTLKSAAGTLSESDLQRVNGWLER
ncbi:MAG: type I secretion protein TolC [gamma proteobacterium symbiont of Ctena orbiculata]|uniref:TolC family outer membrane protein n=1 Tax=Candidatus Thiodiazotropha taylori TaxID=2792791 RepID=A0A944MC38_9GAMM|nr:TolC family outer membrane protein [Candidatus Thiodiazotropha taylori]PUB84726.1 MAG: type I secretion protein TolC [gamma proteobacterium symbiont of Ctena orbiculata]MBT2989964.1 TolC family outer membrane protein [Candidatus Thiodiazotropha taylori]MBT2998313.1 TolC family outer membrane protein [Candidatus Thiodiazotropha taylori]MBT3002576.1 TolC family outer membrane protein [Candidatus Thiodiazotropha taylori]